MKKFSEMISNFRAWLRRQIPYLIVILLILVLVVVFFWSRIFIIIKSGEAGALYRLFWGTVTDYVYSEGLNIIPPWDTMYIYNVRIQTVLHHFQVLTNKGLPVKLELAIRYRPEYDMVAVLHQQVGPNYLNTIIIPQVESVLRKNLGHLDPVDIYVNKEGILTKIMMQVLDEAGQKYLIIEDVIIRRVSLPDSIERAIENKLVEEQRYYTYVYRLEKEKQEAERKRIEAGGIKDYQEIISTTLNDQLIKWQGVQATLSLAESENAKIVVIGAGEEGLPIILGTNK